MGGKYLNSFIYVMSPTMTKIGSSGYSTCPHCSQTVAEADVSIKCDKCGCWAHIQLYQNPPKALTYKTTDGVFWFCNECTKSVRKIAKMKSYTDTELRESRRSNRHCKKSGFRVSGVFIGIIFGTEKMV